MTLLTSLLTIAMTLTVIGPGALATADPGVLENVAALRVRYGWGLEVVPDGAVLLAVQDCELIGFEGVAWTELGAIPVVVVDCQQRQHLGCCGLHKNGLVADCSEPRLNHRQAVLLLWQQ